MKRLLLNLLAIVSVTLVFGGSAWAEETKATFNLVTFTAAKNVVFNDEQANASVQFNKSSNISPATGERGLRWQQSIDFTVSVPTGKIIKSVNLIIKTGTTQNANLQAVSKEMAIIISSANDDGTKGTYIENWTTITEKADNYVWNNNNNLSNTSLNFSFTGKGDIYINTMEVIFDDPASSDFVLTTEDTDYYTLYLDYNATIPAGVTAYTGKLNADESKVNVTPVTGNVLPANTAVLVKTTTAGSYTFAKTDETADEITGNDLKGVAVETAVSDVEVTGKTLLTLGTSDDGVVGFRRPSYENIEANKAYILVDKQTSEKQSVIGIGTGGDTTGITGIQTDTQAGDTTTYNIAGQRVNDNAKGLLIRNGKKFIRK